LYWAHLIRRATNILQVLAWIGWAVYRELLFYQPPQTRDSTHEPYLRSRKRRFFWLGLILVELFLLIGLLWAAIGWSVYEVYSEVSGRFDLTYFIFDPLNWNWFVGQAACFVLFWVSIRALSVMASRRTFPFAIAKSSKTSDGNVVGRANLWIFLFPILSTVSLSFALQKLFLLPILASVCLSIGLVVACMFLHDFSIRHPKVDFRSLYWRLTWSGAWWCVISLPLLITALSSEGFRVETGVRWFLCAYIIVSILKLLLLPIRRDDQHREAVRENWGQLGIGIICASFVMLSYGLASQLTDTTFPPQDIFGQALQQLLQPLKEVPLIKQLLEPVYGWDTAEPSLAFWLMLLSILLIVYRYVSTMLVDYFGDIAVFVTHDETQVSSDLRARILTEATAKLEYMFGISWMEDGTVACNPRFERVGIVAHSLGCCVTYDALNRLVVRLSAASQSQKADISKTASYALERVKSSFRLYLTYGCILEEVRFYFGRRYSGSSYYDQLTTLDLGFYSCSGKSIFADNWFNIRSMMDPFTWPGLISFAEKGASIPTFEVRSLCFPFKAHTDYMRNADVMRCLRELINRQLV
jgi:hypothetical protein